METKIVVFLVSTALIIIFSKFLMKSLGMNTYDDDNKQKEYEEWLKKEGDKRVVTSIITLIFLVSYLLYFLFFL